ncbi:WD40 repeat domain-containing protein [Vreelandella profundi]|uniref:WD40 repeat domain-containing protein n=1 Tax=Vreelandella profundi TaxID=2852117 RepID=UPI001EEFC497|nr:WD40 repeat domain-containing protein [Halomonas profundi]
MSQPASILEQLGCQWQWSAYVLSACFDKANNLAFALGDGSVRLLPANADNEPIKTQAHQGAVLSLSSAPKAGFLSGGDDGCFRRIDADGTANEMAAFQGCWIDHVASHANGMMACTEGNRLNLYAEKGQPLVREFPSTIGGICFAPNGYRMAVAHYGGVTLCSTRSAESAPVSLKCPGSHLAVTWSPDSRFVISAMQEECLRGWRLEDNDALFMSGYSAKVKSWSGSMADAIWPPAVVLVRLAGHSRAAKGLKDVSR